MWFIVLGYNENIEVMLSSRKRKSFNSLYNLKAVGCVKKFLNQTVARVRVDAKRICVVQPEGAADRTKHWKIKQESWIEWGENPMMWRWRRHYWAGLWTCVVAPPCIRSTDKN